MTAKTLTRVSKRNASKTGGLHLYGHRLASADSMAWSYAARREPPLPGCTGHKNCANCLRYAGRWRDNVLSRLTGGWQDTLFDLPAA
jgi:hypothetical protein